MRGSLCISLSRIATMTIPVLVSWLFLMLSIYSSLFGHVVVVVGQCLSHQQSLLLQLKHAIIFNETSSKILVNWNESSDCSTWPGITCDDDGRVIGLKLSNEGISGGIDDNSTLFNLVDLKSLDLSSNEDLQSEIPSRIGNLTNLNYLNLSYSFWYQQIPKTISLLNKLLILDLSDIYAESSNLSMFKNLTRLEELYLDGINMSTSRNEWGQALSSSLPNLRVLSLISCSLSGPIDKSLAKLQYLSVVQLDSNDLSSSEVPKFFANFSNLTTLSLSGCSLYGMFPKEIFQVPTLRILDISVNELLSGSLPEFPLDSDLQSLVLHLTNFSGSLPVSIGNLGQLSRLDIFYCQFSGSLPKSMTNLTQLVHLDLSSNMFTVPIPSFNMSKNLIEIDLSDNSLNGNIPSSLFALPSLERIDLSNNQFSGVVEFPNVSSSVLNSVYLSGNNLQVLNSIDLSSNKLQGTIPSSLFALPSLEEIDLANNQFTGVDEFPNVSSSVLNSIDLSSNKLQEIQIVDVASNNFSGELPFQCLKTWQAMMTVAYVQKRVYITVSSLLRDESLYYEDVVTVTNKHLEMDLVKIPQGFTCIDFSSNNFYGEIPKELGLLKNLMVLNLSDNALSGHIPSSFGNMHQLESLDLSSNRLNGEIPASLSNLNFLEVLDLSHNQLSGRIPKGTQIQTFLAASFQDNEGLCGPPLTPSCKNDEVALPPKTSHEASHHNSGNKEIKWDLISAEVGFIVGFGTVIGPLVFSSKWRKRYYDRVEDIAYSILPNLLLEKWLSWKMGMRK
nr:receptor-like protein 43 isoform X3 [Ziziphus jujuba var. spinosa]